MAFSVSYIYELVDRYSAKLKKITAGTKKFETRIKKAGVALKKFGAKTQALGKRMSSFWVAAAAGAALLVPTKAAIDFESKMADVKKAVNDIKTPKQLKEMKGVIFAISKQLGIMPGEVADLAAEAGKMGIPMKDMRTFLELAGSAAVAFDMSGKLAGEVIGKIKKQYKLTLAGTRGLLDAVNYLADNTIAKAEGILNVLTRVQGRFNLLKFPPEIAAGWSAAALSLTGTAELAASGLRQIFKALPELTKLKDPAGGLLRVFERLSEIKTPEELEKAVTNIFGAGEGAELALKYSTNLGLLKDTLHLMAIKANFAGSMQKELAIKMATATVKLNILKASLKILAITIGESLLPTLKKVSEFITPLIDKITKWVKTNQELTKRIMLAVGAVAGLGVVLRVIGIVISFIFTKAVLIAIGIIMLFIAAIAWLSIHINQAINDFYSWKKVVKDFLEWWDKAWPKAWDKFKEDLTKMKNFFLSIFQEIKNIIDSTIEKIENLTKKVKGTWIGKAIGALTTGVDIITNPVKAFAGSESSPDLLPMPTPKSAISLGGQIDINVTGPGKVTGGSLTTDTGGDLGFNMPW